MRSSSVHGDVGTRYLAGVEYGLAGGSSCAQGVQTFLGFCVWLRLACLMLWTIKMFVVVLSVYWNSIWAVRVGTYTLS